MQFSPNDRHILVLTGKQTDSLRYAKEITSELDSVNIVDPKKAQGSLGQEFDAVIFDMDEQFDPNAFGAVSGTIRGGGFLILLRSLSFNKESLFLTRFNQILENTPQVTFLETNTKKQLLLPQPEIRNFPEIYASNDQAEVVSAIIKVVKGHRRRPLVITSDRGRGKSAALGIAAAELAKNDVKNIIICAFSKKTVSMVFKHTELGLTDQEKSNLTFYSPDELNQQKPKADLVLIDEAAALPVPLLTSLLKHYSRIVFASTQHGYEGHGRGFAINFRKVLDQESPEWRNINLKTPIRWNENDSLEQFTNDALLLNTNLTNPPSIEKITNDECIFRKIPKYELIENNDTLKQFFGLLVNAHYQTKPSDLMQLLDDENITICCLEIDHLIVAVSLIISEGNIEPELLPDIFSGKRRLKGHLVAQSLSSNVGIEYAPKLSGERISRIAVHPLLQGQGLGSTLIQNLIDKSKADYLSTSFGATDLLINFWQRARFSAIHLGLKRDASSGEHSVMMLYPKNDKGMLLEKKATNMFSNSFPHLLSDPLRSIESEIVLPLLPKSKKLNIDEEEQKALYSFAYEYRGYENSLYLIWELTYKKLGNSQLNKQEKNMLVIKVLQKRSWEELIQQMRDDFSGKKQALSLMRRVIRKLL